MFTQGGLGKSQRCIGTISYSFELLGRAIAPAARLVQVSQTQYLEEDRRLTKIGIPDLHQDG